MGSGISRVGHRRTAKQAQLNARRISVWRSKRDIKVDQPDLGVSSKYKVLVVGASASGKTAVCQRFISNQFQIDHHPTAKVAVGMKFLQLQWKGSLECTSLQVWDCPSHAGVTELLDLYTENVHGAVIVADCTDVRTFREVAVWVLRLQDHLHENIPIVLMANKADSPSRIVSQEQVSECAKQFKLDGGFAVSAAYDTNIEAAFSCLLREMIMVAGRAVAAAPPRVGEGHRARSLFLRGGLSVLPPEPVLPASNTSNTSNSSNVSSEPKELNEANQFNEGQAREPNTEGDGNATTESNQSNKSSETRTVEGAAKEEKHNEAAPDLISTSPSKPSPSHTSGRESAGDSPPPAMDATEVANSNGGVLG